VRHESTLPPPPQRQALRTPRRKLLDGFSSPRAPLSEAAVVALASAREFLHRDAVHAARMTDVGEDLWVLRTMADVGLQSVYRAVMEGEGRAEGWYKAMRQEILACAAMAWWQR